MSFPVCCKDCREFCPFRTSITNTLGYLQRSFKFIIILPFNNKQYIPFEALGL